MSSSAQLLALPFLPAAAAAPPHLEIFEERSPLEDLACCDDLVKKVKQGDQWAFEALARLLERQRRALVHQVLGSWGLGSAVFDDAEQEALLMTWEAARRFDFEQAARDGCTFLSYAWGLMHKKVSNFARSVWRQGRHYERSPASAVALEEGGRSKRRGTDPAEEAARRERQRRLAKFFARQPERMRLFWDMLVAKMKLPQIAMELGITQRQAKRWKAKLDEALRKEVKPYWD